MNTYFACANRMNANFSIHLTVSTPCRATDYNLFEAPFLYRLYVWHIKWVI